MDSFFIRFRNLLVLLLILAAQIIGLAVQVRRNGGQNGFDSGDGSGVRLIRLWANGIVTPPERLMQQAMGVQNIWQDYVDLRNTRQQNKDLQKTIDRLRLEQASLLEDAKQGERLQALLGFQQHYVSKTVPAQVIGTSGSDQSRVFYLDKGSAEGLARDMAVITPDGIVGKVRDVFPHSAQVLAVNDQTSGAGVMLESTRLRGILRGNGAGQLQVVGIIADPRIQPGEKISTAGGDQIFPRGLPVGVVEKVVRDPDRDSFINVIVKPSANLSRLDEVLVITSTEAHFSPPQQQDLATSVALKGADAAVANEQKKASEIMAERLPGLVDPNLPADQQPLHDTSLPNPVAHPPLPLHPDRFTPSQAEPVPAPIRQHEVMAKKPVQDATGQKRAGTAMQGVASKTATVQAKPAQTKPKDKTKTNAPLRRNP